MLSFFEAHSRFAVFALALLQPVDSFAGQPQSSVTFNKEIAPILYSRCATCHRPDGAAPFELISYESAKRRATQIAEVTRSRLMPPWKTEPGYGGAYVDQHPLTTEQIDLIDRWVKEGAAEGGAGDRPRVPSFPSGWLLGSPDQVLTFPEPYLLAAGGADTLRVFVIPIPTGSRRYVRGLEFRPGNSSVVHHANIRIDRTVRSRQLDAEDPQPGYEGLMANSAVYPDGHFLAWTPGQVAPLLPKGLAWTLDPGTDLVVELHLQPTGKPEKIAPSFGLYYTSDPPSRTPAMIRLGRQDIDIPAGENAYTLTDSYVLPVNVELEAVQPHAHYRAREIRGTATLPDGTMRWLIYIKDWDFRWQHVYRYVLPLKLPKGTTLAMRFSFDNSASNPRNPQQPPVRVRWGQRSRDEMGDLWIQALPGNGSDLDTLERAFRPKVLAEDTLGYEREIERDEDNVPLHDDVAQIYLTLGRTEEAVKHFAASARLNPSSASTHFNLGTALILAGRAEEARVEFDRALALRPDYAQAHNNLGSLFLQVGRSAEALAHFREALRIEPGNVEAQSNLGTALAATGDFKSAVEALQRASALSPAEPLATSIRERLALYRQGRLK